MRGSCTRVLGLLTLWCWPGVLCWNMIRKVKFRFSCSHSIQRKLVKKYIHILRQIQYLESHRQICRDTDIIIICGHCAHKAQKGKNTWWGLTAVYGRLTRLPQCLTMMMMLLEPIQFHGTAADVFNAWVLFWMLTCWIPGHIPSLLDSDQVFGSHAQQAKPSIPTCRTLWSSFNRP